MFENHSVFENLELAMKTDKRVRPPSVRAADSEQLDRIAQTLDLIQLMTSKPTSSRDCCRTGRSSGSRSAC